MADLLATAYLSPAKSLSRPGAPGAPLRFLSGMCRIYDPRLVMVALRQPDVTVIPDERYESHAVGWARDCGPFQPARAKIAMSDGRVLEPPYE